jgi:DNA-directed RNA polymerase specialized sigma24 family protein
MGDRVAGPRATGRILADYLPPPTANDLEPDAVVHIFNTEYQTRSATASRSSLASTRRRYKLQAAFSQASYALAGWSTGEAARRLGLPRRSTDNALQRAKRKLHGWQGRWAA